jgi:hypothetical protein
MVLDFAGLKRAVESNECLLGVGVVTAKRDDVHSVDSPLS